MGPNKFTNEDKQRFIEFLNQVAAHATFTVKTQELISLFKNLAHMQQVMLPKIEANILEVVKVHENNNSQSEG